MSINKTKLPKIGKWIVKYDDVYQMPQFIQGKIVGNAKKSVIGNQVMIKNIESIDLIDNIVTTYNGTKYNLIGAGRRMILIAEDEYLEIAYAEDEYEEN